jgi:hypothetical protein
MAYELYYTAHFTNEQSQSVEIYIYKKDADPPEAVEVYEVSEDNGRCNLTDNSEGQTKYECIIVRELSLSLWTTDDKSLTWETFIDAEHDTWKIEVIIDTQKYFEGFITPDEGNAPFQDKPYDVNILATNSLALLKGTELSDIIGDPFDGDHPIIDYIAGALKKTGLDLPIRIYCGYFHLAMQNKGDSLNNDMFQQAKLNYRTFQKDPTTFVSCYDALKIILDKFCTLEYWNGMWLIASIAEKQYIPDARYYVDYDSDGAVVSGAIDTNNYGRIGKQMEIYPINENQEISSRFAVKSVVTKYIYTIWPELPRNNKFERGTEFDTGVALDEDDIDNDGDTSEVIGTYKKFTIDDYQYGKFTSANSTFPFVPGADDNYRESIYNAFGVEIERKIVLANTTGTNNYLLPEGIPVYSQDKIKISFDFKHTGGAVDFGTVAIFRAYIYRPGTTNAPLWLHNSMQWRTGTVDSVDYFYDNGEDSSKWRSFSFEPDIIPNDGTLYVLMQHGNAAGDYEYRNFTLEYIPFVAGGYIQVKGDYWKRIQSGNFPDVIDEEVFISDSPKKLLKGALLFNDQLTDPAWYRHGPTTDANILDETRHFKELLNKARFNHSYRRMYALEGDFNGLNFAAENNPTNKLPIGFFWMYREVDMTTPRDFVLVPPLKMDIMRGWITANLVEVKKDSNDGTQEGTAEFKYIF